MLDQEQDLLFISCRFDIGRTQLQTTRLVVTGLPYSRKHRDGFPLQAPLLRDLRPAAEQLGAGAGPCRSRCRGRSH